MKQPLDHHLSFADCPGQDRVPSSNLTHVRLLPDEVVYPLVCPVNTDQLVPKRWSAQNVKIAIDQRKTVITRNDHFLESFHRRAV